MIITAEARRVNCQSLFSFRNYPKATRTRDGAQMWSSTTTRHQNPWTTQQVEKLSKPVKSTQAYQWKWVEDTLGCSERAGTRCFPTVKSGPGVQGQIFLFSTNINSVCGLPVLRMSLCLVQSREAENKVLSKRSDREGIFAKSSLFDNHLFWEDYRNTLAGIGNNFFWLRISSIFMD